MAEKMIKIELLSSTIQAEEIIALAAKLCYSSVQIEDLQDKIEANDQANYIQKLVSMGHLSPFEHASLCFAIEGVSRAMLAQITRHRIASFSVQSQRYVDQSKEGMNFIVPLSIKKLGQEAVDRYEQQMYQTQLWYEEWCHELGDERREDARFVLPNACETRMLVTMNVRELLHFFSLRCCQRAQWEIRIVAWIMLGHSLAVAPEIFMGAGANCVSGECTEGRMSCGKMREIRLHAQQLSQFVEQHKDNPDFSRMLEQWAYANNRI